MAPIEVNKVYYISLSQPSIPADPGNPADPGKPAEDSSSSEFQQTVNEAMRWGLSVDEIKDFKEEKNDFIR